MYIKILGTGCPNCKKLEENVKKTLEQKERDDKIEKIEDIQEIMKYDVMAMPALVVDEELKSSGKVLSVEEIQELLNL